MTTFHPKLWTVVVAISLCFTNALGGAAFAGIVFDAVDDFSTLINSEISTWSYRSSADDTRDGAYSLLTTVSDSYPFWDQPTPFWNNAGVPIPGIGANQSGAPLKFVANSSTFYWPDETIWMHPYEFGLAVLSWRSPSDGVFDISYSFADMDPNGVTAGFGNGIKWFVDRNDSSGVFALAQGTIAEGGDSTGLLTLANISVLVGDRIDFVVSAPLTEKPTVTEKLFDREVMVETSTEIVAKKIWHRGDRFRARDIFDLALVAEREPAALWSITPILQDRREVVLNWIASREVELRDDFKNLDVLEYRPTFDKCVATVRDLFHNAKA